MGTGTIKSWDFTLVFKEGPKVLVGTTPAGVRVGYPLAILRKAFQHPMPYDFMPHIPIDERPKLPRDRTNIYQFADTRHYAPGTRPKGKCIEQSRFETYTYKASDLIPGRPSDS